MSRDVKKDFRVLIEHELEVHFKEKPSELLIAACLTACSGLVMEAWLDAQEAREVLEAGRGWLNTQSALEQSRQDPRLARLRNALLQLAEINRNT